MSSRNGRLREVFPYGVAQQGDAAVPVGIVTPDLAPSQPHRPVANASDHQVSADCDRPARLPGTRRGHRNVTVFHGRPSFIYHFATKDRLVTEVLHEARRRQQALFGELLQPRPGVPYPDVLRAAWQQLTSPEAMPYHRLFRELHDLPAESSPWKGFPAHATDEWLAVVTAGLQPAGYKDPQVAATLIVAAARGLLLDLQVTSDPERADAAFGTLIDLLTESQTGTIRQ
jgi:AcrR family transcriptional regulator